MDSQLQGFLAERGAYLQHQGTRGAMGASVRSIQQGGYQERLAMIDAELVLAEMEWRNALRWADEHGRWIGTSTTLQGVPEPIWNELQRTGKQINDVRSRKQWEYL